MKTKKELEVVICDFCGKEVWNEKQKCIICGKDVCDECNRVKNLPYKAFRFYLCPDELAITIERFIEIADKKLK